MPARNKTISFAPAINLQTKEPCEISLSPQERSGGVYILGLPRSGKTTLMVNMMLQDAINGLGFLFIDPHGDAAYDVLYRLPAHRRKDVIFIDPTDDDYCFSINLFECKNPNSTKEVSRVISSVQQVFSKLFIPEGETAITLETTLLNLTILLIYNQGYTLADAAFLLEEKDILQKLVNNIDRRRHFNNYRWWQRYISMKKQDSDKEILSTIRRLLIFTTDEFVRHIVAQTKSTLDFRDIIDNKKIVLVRLQREFEELSRLTGALIIDRLLQAVYSRDDTAIEKRPYFSLYCDEFQNYATADMAKLFTQTGKYHLLPTLAHQERTGQLSEKDVVVGATLAAPHKILFTVSDYDAKTFASTFALASPAGEPIKEQVMERQWVEETVITWEPPESEEQYTTELQRLLKKKENTILKAAILYAAVFGPLEHLTLSNDIFIPELLKKIESISTFYSIETYNNTGSFVIPKTHTVTYTEPGQNYKQAHTYTLDPVHNPLVKAFTPTVPHKQAIYYDPLAEFDTDLQEIEDQVAIYKKQEQQRFRERIAWESSLTGLQKFKYESSGKSLYKRLIESRFDSSLWESHVVNPLVFSYKDMLIAEAKEKRRAALVPIPSLTYSMPDAPLPFTLFLEQLQKPIQGGTYHASSSLRQIEIIAHFTYKNSHAIRIDGTTREGFIVPEPDDTRNKTIEAAREIQTAFNSATHKHRDTVVYMRDVWDNNLQEGWINNLKTNSSILWQWRYFKQGAYWFLLACQELAKQIVTCKKEVEDFARDFPAQHKHTEIIKIDTGIDVPAKKFMGYRSATSYTYRGQEFSSPSEPQYEPLYTYKPGKPMFSPLEMEKYMEGELANIPRYSAYAKFAHDVNGVQQIDKVKLTPPDMPPPPPPQSRKRILDLTRDNTRKQYCTLRVAIEEALYKRIEGLESPAILPQEGE